MNNLSITKNTRNDKQKIDAQAAFARNPQPLLAALGLRVDDRKSKGDSIWIYDGAETEASLQIGGKPDFAGRWHRYGGDNKQGDSFALVQHCRPGTDFKEALRVVADTYGVTVEQPVKQPKKTSKTIYNAVSLEGEVLGSHHRHDFDDGTKKVWWTGLEGRHLPSLPPYKMPDILNMASGSTIIITEGEKACDALRGTGVTACGTWGAEVIPADDILAHLAPYDVVLWPDNDTPGARHMQTICNRLHELGIPCRVINWPEAPAKGDAADFVQANSIEELPGLIASAELYEPQELATVEEAKEDDENEPIREQLIRLAEAAGTCIRTPLGERYFAVDGGLLSLAKGGPVRRWLVNKYRDATGKTPNNTALTEALYTLEAATDNGPAVEVSLRIAQRENVIYIDLGKRVVCCTSECWLVLEQQAIPADLHFLRPDGMATLPTPVTGGHLRELAAILPDCEEQILLIAWVLGTLMPGGPFPLLCLSGEQGSGKSTVARILRYLVDPKGTAPGDNLSRPPKDERDLWVSAGNQRVLALDNLTKLSSDLSDALAAVSTGASYEGRKLYTDSETSYISACRPVILTAIGAVAVRGDLLDRSLQVALPVMTQPQAERELWQAVEQARPRILGALCDCVCAALRYQNTVNEPLPRMADFARWILAIEKQGDLVPWTPGEFMPVLMENRKQAQAIAAGASTLTEPLLRIAENGFTGKAGELLDELNSNAKEETIRNRDWPKTAAALGTKLNELAPALRGQGVEITHTRPYINGKQVKQITIKTAQI